MGQELVNGEEQKKSRGREQKKGSGGRKKKVQGVRFRAPAILPVREVGLAVRLGGYGKSPNNQPLVIRSAGGPELLSSRGS